MTETQEDYTPRVVVFGAGPIGLEAALYGRYLGYDVAVFDRGRVANNVLCWGHVKMFSPFEMNRSMLGVAALKAQDETVELPEPKALLTGKEFAEQYLIPLAKSDLLAGCVHEDVEVLQVGRDGILKTDALEHDRSEYPFRVLFRSHEGEEIVDADVVIDTTGVFDQPRYLGHGGIPALCELECRSHIWTQLPDVLGKDRSRFEGKRTLVVGNGYTAATNIVNLARLVQDNPQTQVTWVTRRESPPTGPMPVTANDPLPQRSQLAKDANSSGVDHVEQSAVVAIFRDEAKQEFKVSFGGKLTGDQDFDEVISSVGYRPNCEIYSELQVEECPATQAPRGIGEWLVEVGPIDAVEQELSRGASIIHREPGFFILGSKSFGRNSNFLLSLGFEQIRDAFAVVADRQDLDLYKTMSHFQ